MTPEQEKRIIKFYNANPVPRELPEWMVFISTLLTEAIQEERKRIIAEIKEMKDDYILDSGVETAHASSQDQSRESEFLRAADDIIQLVNKGV